MRSVLPVVRISVTSATELRPGMTYWDISVSLPKSEFGVKKCKYLEHDISSDGIRTSQKLAEKVLNLPLPKTQNGVQSFHRSLNYYAKYIRDLPVLAATLCEAPDEQTVADEI
ncbi:reverse transcriptase [Phytophthora megakarya]|uniref:Reverse transcriptase n=1 Tax=Phytophthora megakarya TaxID=4795 RepID=A0A225W6Y4_9STRA|nr:reverse transcriptase [Phytophthora megakarya]